MAISRKRTRNRWEPKQWRAHYVTVDPEDPARLVLQELFPARATETKRQILTSRDPHTSLAASMATGPAWYYREFIAGSDKARERLVEHISQQLVSHAQANRMRLKEGLEMIWADVILKRHIGAMSDRKAAQMLGIKAVSQYHTQYKPHELGPLLWIKSWADQSRR